MDLQIVPFSFYFVKSGSLFIVCQTHTRTKVLPSSVFAPVTLIETETFRPNRSTNSPDSLFFYYFPGHSLNNGHGSICVQIDASTEKKRKGEKTPLKRFAAEILTRMEIGTSSPLNVLCHRRHQSPTVHWVVASSLHRQVSKLCRKYVFYTTNNSEQIEWRDLSSLHGWLFTLV